jgi:long-chain fatty acid transport protein
MSTSRTLVSFAVVSALAAFAGGAQASGFALIEQNASGIGNAYAGQAASAQDASTIFFNPAGMTLLPGRQVVFAGHAIRPSAEFTNNGSAAPVFLPLGDNGGDAGDWAFVPNAYLSWQLTPKWFVGVGLNAPFGLKTEYSTTWVGRMHAVESDLKTININPSVAYKVNDQVSLGAGISYQRAEATLSNQVNYAGAVAAVLGAGAGAAIAAAGQGEGLATVEGDDDAFGYNLGAMFSLNPNTRIGLSYRSSISYNITGTATFGNRPAALAAALPDGPVYADIKMPASASVSLFHKLNPKWDLLADVSWTKWSSIETLNIVRVGGAAPLTTTPLNWSDTWRLSIGANYHVNSAWTLRMGLAYDESPVPDLDRTPRIPDNDRTWLAFGGQYRLSKQGAIDFGYAYLHVKDPSVNLCGPATAATAGCRGKNNLVGNYDNSVHIFSAQYRYNF